MYFKLLGIVLWSYHLEKALHDSFCRHFIYCCDWIRLHWLGPECGVFWMALYSNGQHRTALGRTSLDSAGVHCTRHWAPDWNTLHCTSVGGTGLDWTGKERTARHGTGLLQLSLMDLGCSGWKYIAMYLRGWDWTGVSGTRLYWTREHCTLLHWTAIDYTDLQHSLHSTGLDLERLFWISQIAMELMVLHLTWMQKTANTDW